MADMLLSPWATLRGHLNENLVLPLRHNTERVLSRFIWCETVYANSQRVKKKHYKNKETRCQLSSDRGKYTYIATNKSSARWTHLAPVTVFAIGQQNKRNSLALTQKTYVLLRNHSDFDSPIFYSVELTRTQTNQNQTQGGPRILTGLLGLFRIHVIADTIILAESWDQIPLMS